MFGFKICLLGDGGVGKTSLREKFLGKGFTSGYTLNIGGNFQTKQVDIYGTPYNIHIWDLEGRPHPSEVQHLFYIGSRGAIFVFDITRPDSLYNLNSWKKELFITLGRQIPYIILGNKNDLQSKIEEEEISAFIDQSKQEIHGTPCDIKYLRTSAKYGENVIEAFSMVGQLVIDSDPTYYT